MLTLVGAGASMAAGIYLGAEQVEPQLGRRATSFGVWINGPFLLLICVWTIGASNKTYLTHRNFVVPAECVGFALTLLVCVLGSVKWPIWATAPNPRDVDWKRLIIWGLFVRGLIALFNGALVDWLVAEKFVG